MLLFILIPMGTGLLLRAFGGDGWQDFGIKPNLKSGLAWYIAALFIFPLVSVLAFGAGSIFGAFSFPGGSSRGVGVFVSLVAVSFASSFIKNIFEEFAWRGYLTARFDSIKLNPVINHLLTGLIWAGWQIPYWLYFIDVRQVSSLNLSTFVLFGILTLSITGITYGELRLLSKSVWPGVILHSLANAITATLLLNGFIKLNGWLGVVFSPGNDGLLHALLFTLVGLGLYQYRRFRSQP
jgi:membrane protease YdiL (CAAX protease family)